MTRPATHGSSEPFVVNPGSPASVLGMFRATFQRQPTKTSPPTSISSPLRFNADGSSRSTTSGPQKLYDSAVKTGADFSAYNNNPFYQNSTVKLPIRPTECVPSGTDKYPAPAPLIFKGITDTPFTGDIRSYSSWRDAFIRLVHAPGRIMQDSERLLYLKQCLKGPPLDLISRYPINDIGYQFATTQLESRFFNPTKTIFLLRQDLHAVRPPANTYNDLLRFQQDLVHICGNFLQAGDDISYKDWCVDIVMTKLPLNVRLALSQRKRDQGDTTPWTISQLLEELQRALDIMSDAYLYEGATHQQPSGSRQRPNRPLTLEHPYGSSSERTGGTYVGATLDAPASRACAFCGAKGSHWSSDCTRYVSISERYERAKELDYCFACLRKDHWRNADACRVTRTCPHCKRGRHHMALCETHATEQRSKGREPPRSGKKKKKTSNRSAQRGSHPTEDDRQGRTQDRAPYGAGGPVAPGTATPHRTDSGPRQSRGPHGGRVQMHAAATGNEDASHHTDGQVPVQEDFGGAGPYGDLQQPSGSLVTDSYAYDSVHPTHTDGRDHPTEDDNCSVVTHDSDAPTEPGMKEEYDFYDPYSQQGFATVGATHFTEQPTHANFLECVMATVFHPTTKKHKRVAVFFDSGSDGTFVRRELAQELGLPNLGDSPLHLDTFAQDKPVRLDAFRTQLGFKQNTGRDLVLGLKASPKLVKSLKAVFIKPTDVALLKKNQCDLVPQHVVPDVLIGRDTQHLFLKRDEYPPLPNGFCLLHTTLGTIVAGSGRLQKGSSDPTRPTHGTSVPHRTVSSGPISSETATTGQIGSSSVPFGTQSRTDAATTTPKVVRFADATTTATSADKASSEAPHLGSSDPPPAAARMTVSFAKLQEEESLHEMAQNFWQTENIGIEKNDPRKEDDLVHERIRKTIHLDPDGRYQIRLPWKTKDGEPPSNQELPTHLGLARGRLGSFQRSHVHQPEFLRKYGAGFDEMEADGVIEKFNPKDRTIAFLHLMAHHAVIKESSATTKVRAVFDGSAHLPGMPCINDYLHRGPVLLPTMAGILLRTRVHGIVVIADIAKAFLQVSLHPADRSACAFLWLKDPTKPPDDDNLVFYRFTRVTFGLKPSPFLLGAVIQFHLEHQGPLAEEIWRNCYVDNIILSADSLDEALEKYRGTKELFASAKMNVRQFASNCKEFNRQMPPEDLADLDHLMNLGYNWHVETDTWHVSYVPKRDKTSERKRKGPKQDDGRLTKRKMLRQIMRIFDPLSLTGPALLAAKLAVQEAMKLPLKWDDYVGDDIAAIWLQATKDFQTTTYKIPWHICATPISSLELHICVDASQDAYGFASYIRVPLDDAGTKFEVSLAFSRCKVKPISADEKMTIPRMELMAMALGARNALFLKEELFNKQITRVTIWSDSMIVLQQLRNREKSKERFVENRLKEIRELQEQLDFDTRYVHTSENPGDIISRGIPAADLHSCDLWWKGIPFLRGPDSEWPAQPNAQLEPTPPEDSSESLIVEQGSRSGPYEQSFFVQSPRTIWSA